MPWWTYDFIGFKDTEAKEALKSIHNFVLLDGLGVKRLELIMFKSHFFLFHFVRAPCSLPTAHWASHRNLSKCTPWPPIPRNSLLSTFWPASSTQNFFFASVLLVSMTSTMCGIETIIPFEISHRACSSWSFCRQLQDTHLFLQFNFGFSFSRHPKKPFTCIILLFVTYNRHLFSINE